MACEWLAISAIWTVVLKKWFPPKGRSTGRVGGSTGIFEKAWKAWWVSGTCHDGSLKHPMSRHVLHTVGYKMWIIHCLYHTGATVCRVMVRICQNPEWREGRGENFTQGYVKDFFQPCVVTLMLEGDLGRCISYYEKKYVRRKFANGEPFTKIFKKWILFHGIQTAKKKNEEGPRPRAILRPFPTASRWESFLVVTTWYSIRKVWKDDFYT